MPYLISANAGDFEGLANYSLVIWTGVALPCILSTNFVFRRAFEPELTKEILPERIEFKAD